MNGAQDLDYDTFTQGAGMVDASRSVSLAAGNGGISVSPGAWYPGDYRGTEYVSYVDLVYPGDTVTDSLLVKNTGAASASVTVSDSWLELQSTTTMTVTLDSGGESAYDFNRPDYLADITSLVQAADADLLVVKADETFADSLPPARSAQRQARTTCRGCWSTMEGPGLRHCALGTDSNERIRQHGCEIDAGEYMRFLYANNFANSQQVRVQNPSTRMLDGNFLGLQQQHRARRAIPQWWSRSHRVLVAGGSPLAVGRGKLLHTRCRRHDAADP